jgi:hypothetical protein
VPGAFAVSGEFAEFGPPKRTAMRSARAGQYRAETTITETNATMNHSPPFKPNTHVAYGSFSSPASPLRCYIFSP